MSTEADCFIQLRDWAVQHGGFIHSSLSFVAEPGGTAVVAIDDIPADTAVVSCPFDMAITPGQASIAVAKFFAKNSTGIPQEQMLDWNERMRICSYIIAHWIVLDTGVPESNSGLDHFPYIQTFPPMDVLSTPLLFNDKEMELLRGTNLYGATSTKKLEWESEWQRCLTTFKEWAFLLINEFTWERYLTAATHLSSRAFPSTLLSTTPTLLSDANPHPILLPIVDSLNHARAQPVSWLVDNSPLENLQISVIQHRSIPKGSQVFNNYGPKPNSELLLGYGFVIPHNPNDTLILKIGGGMKGWEVGRTGDETVIGLWEEILGRLNEGSQGREEVSVWETQLEAADVLSEMIQAQISKLPKLRGTKELDGVREHVRWMIQVYIEGQNDILHLISSFAEIRRQEAIQMAKDDGVDLIFDDSDGE